MIKKGPEFLKKKYGDLHISQEVKRAVARKEKREGERVSQKPEERIQVCLDRFKELTEREDEEKRLQGIEVLKRVLLKKYVMTQETVPESHFERERRRSRELGLGDVELTEEQREELAETVIRDENKRCR